MKRKILLLIKSYIYIYKSEIYIELKRGNKLGDLNPRYKGY